MHAFDSLQEVESSLQILAETEPPLVCEIERKPGQKESRWELNSTGEETAAEFEDEGEWQPEPDVSPLSLRERVERLEEQVRQILERLDGAQ